MSEFRPLRSGRGLRADPRTDRSVMDNYDPDAPADEASGIAFDPSMVVGPLAASVARRSPFGALAAVLSEGLVSGDANASVVGGLARALGKLRPQMFIGKNAATWDAASASAARKMEKAGTPPREIWSKTGVWRGPDGGLRQEIPDNVAQFPSTPEVDALRDRLKFNKDGLVTRGPYEKTGAAQIEAIENLSGEPLGTVMHHPQAFEAYPTARGILTEFDPSVSGASYNPSAGFGAELMTFGRGSTRGFSTGKSNALHELQHAIQEREKWSRGGAPEAAFRDARMWGKENAKGSDVAHRMLQERLKAMHTPLSPEEYAKQAWQSDVITPEIDADYRKYLATRNPSQFDVEVQKEVAREWYKRLAGEAEARATQSRMGLDATQRRALFPEDSYDVPITELIHRKVGGLAQVKGEK